MGFLGFPVALVPVLHREEHYRDCLDLHLVLHLHHRVLLHHHHHFQPGMVQLLLQMPVLGLAQLV